MKNNNFIRNKVKNTPGKKIKQMITALIMAIAVWFIVINVVNPTVSVWINDTPITFSGEAELREMGLVLTNKDELPPVSIKVRGTRKELLKNVKKIGAEFDLSKIKNQGTVNITPSITLPNSLTLEKQKTQSYELTFELGYEKEVPVVVKQTGDEKIKSKGRIIESIPEKQNITIFGSKKEIENIEYCVININVADISESGKLMYNYEYADGSLVPAQNVSTIYSKESAIRVNNKVLERKSCSVEFKIPEDLHLKYHISADTKYLSPTEIDVGVPEGKSAPDKLTATLKEDDIILGNNELEISIDDIDGIYISENTVKIKADIQKLIEQIIPVTIAIENIPEGLKVPSNPIIEKIHVLMPEDTAVPITATADATNAKPGIYQMEISFDNDKIININNQKISIGFSAK